MNENLQTVIVFLVIIAAVAWSIKRIFSTKKKSCCGNVISGNKNTINKKCDLCEVGKECEMKMDETKKTNHDTQN